jgi:hypothetical protein
MLIDGGPAKLLAIGDTHAGPATFVTKYGLVTKKEQFFVPTLRVQVLRSWSSTSRLNLIKNLDLRSVTSGEPSFAETPAQILNRSTSG